MHGKSVDDKQKKLESSARIAELKPYETLQAIGVKEGSVVCDIGAGTGVFAIPAAKITSNTVYALDIDAEMLERLDTNAKEENITNIKQVLVTDNNLSVVDDTVDFSLLVTVLHELEDKAAFLAQIKRISAKGAKVMVIDFFARKTPQGPPMHERLAEDEVIALFDDINSSLVERKDISENLYCLVFAV